MFDGLWALEKGDHLVEHGVALEIFVVPGYCGVEIGFEHVVDDLRVEGGEAVPVLLQVQRLLEPGEGLGGLDDDEIVDLFAERIEADLEPVELIVDEEEVVDLALCTAGGGGVWFPVVGRAELGGRGFGDVGGHCIVDGTQFRLPG